MHKSSRYPSSNDRSRQLTLHCAALLALCTFCVIPPHRALAQSKPIGAGKSPLCSRDNALEMIKPQVELTKTINNGTRRITVLIRAADLLWPYQQNRARAVFTEAFELAVENEKENADKGPRSVLLRMQVPDQRYVVIRAVAKRDSAWARELTRQMLKLNDQDGEASTRDSFQDTLTAQRLLDSAIKLIASDIAAAFDLARASFMYPASSWLPRFLYQLAGVNQQAADQFYAQALAVYGDKPMREFLYLQAYPFAWRDTINTPVFAFNYKVPANFVINPSLQRRFLEILLRRAHQSLEEVPLDQSDTYRNPNGAWMPGTVHLLQGLVRLEPQVKESLPDLLPPLTQAREKILVSLSVENQRLFLQPGREISTRPEQSFKEEVDSAQKVPDLNERDQIIGSAVLGSDGERIEDVIQAIDKISDSTLRAHFLEWLYFQRATTAINNKQFEEAEKLTSRVEGQPQRAYLHTEIAKVLLNKSETQTQGREVLDEAITEAKKAGMTILSARTLLTASNLYAKIDLGRSISVLADAINCINRIETPDFSSDDQSLENTPVRRGRGGQYQGEFLLRFYMPGLDPERAFREMAKIDFDTTMSQANALTDKFQRAMATLSLAEVCFQQAQQQPKERSKKR